jgi:predicted RNA-binding protein
MCEMHAYLKKAEDPILVMESVDTMVAEGDRIRLSNIFGEEKELAARFLSIENNRILLGENRSGSAG